MIKNFKIKQYPGKKTLLKTIKNNVDGCHKNGENNDTAKSRVGWGISPKSTHLSQ
jgi:hypothetical protein